MPKNLLNLFWIYDVFVKKYPEKELYIVFNHEDEIYIIKEIRQLSEQHFDIYYSLEGSSNILKMDLNNLKFKNFKLYERIKK